MKIRLLMMWGVAFVMIASGEGVGVLETPEAGVYGEAKKWHRLTIAFEGEESSETGRVNPFTDLRLDVKFRHESSGTEMMVPGYFAADGRAGESSAETGNIWRMHFSAPETGEWRYEAVFRKGEGIAMDGDQEGEATVLNGSSDGLVEGTFQIGETDKTGKDNRSSGLLEYVGRRYLKWRETGAYYLKQGADAPENLLAYMDFDGDFKTDGVKDELVKTYGPHVRDWKDGDPSWRGGKGKGLIGALNYLASEGINSISFLTMNIGGDDRNVFPYGDPEDVSRMDMSRLDQWEAVFAHAGRLGMHLHFKTQETENETLLDGGDVGPDRKLYYRELIARFGHHLALNWNLGEENHDQTDGQRREMAEYFRANDPYRHPVVLHTYPEEKDMIYTPLLGSDSELTGVSLQGSNVKFRDAHGDVLEWVGKSAEAGRPWVVAYDEPGSAGHGVTTDEENAKDPGVKGNYKDARQEALWGVLLAGGAGSEWYFGYKYADSDLTGQDFRSRDLWWDQCRAALEFFEGKKVPFDRMRGADELVGNEGSEVGKPYCFAAAEEVYVVYVPEGGDVKLDLSGLEGTFRVEWFDPVKGEFPVVYAASEIEGGNVVELAVPGAGTLDLVGLVTKVPTDG